MEDVFRAHDRSKIKKIKKTEDKDKEDYGDDRREDKNSEKPGW
jgi:hypothetical protein